MLLLFVCSLVISGLAQPSSGWGGGGGGGEIFRAPIYITNPKDIKAISMTSDKMSNKQIILFSYIK